MPEIEKSEKKEILVLDSKGLVSEKERTEFNRLIKKLQRVKFKLC